MKPKWSKMLCSLAATGLLAWSADTPAEDGTVYVRGCLPREAGDVVARLYNQGNIKAVTPTDWKLESANIEKSLLTITFVDGQGRKLGVKLVAPGSDGDLGSGRWFSYTSFSDSGSLEADAKKFLVAAAGVVDAAFQSSPWVPCVEGRKAPVAPASLQDTSSEAVEPGLWSERLYGPPWLFLVFGAIQILVLLGGSVLVFASGLREGGQTSC